MFLFLIPIVFLFSACAGLKDELTIAENNLTFNVNGTPRSAVVFLGENAQTTPAPVVIFFHGFTGTATSSATQINFHGKWPEATVIYAQGLKDQQDGAGKHSYGWQNQPNTLDNRDILYTEELLTQVRALSQVDDNRIYVAGHSNGCMFTYVLLELRSSVFRAFAPTGCYAYSTTLATSGVSGNVVYAFGTQDTVFDKDPTCSGSGANCATSTSNTLKSLNGCTDSSSEWNSGYAQFTCTGADYIFYNYDGGHGWPDGHTDRLVEYFQSLE